MTATTHTSIPSPSGTGCPIAQRSWSSRRLRTVAGARFAVGIFLVGVGAVLISHAQAGLAAVPLAGAALHFVWGSWQLKIARFAPARTAAAGR
jgi:hypothetical protein